MALELQRRIELACVNRDVKGLYRAMAKSRAFFQRDKASPVDLDSVKVAARVYAGQLHGWEIQP